MGKIRLNILGEVPSRVDRDLLRLVTGRINHHQGLKLPEGEVNLKLVDDAAIQALNKDYGQVDEPTDVLSFSYIEQGEPIGETIGEMVISLETASRQADQLGLSLSEELGILTIHGLLHLAGHDHQTSDQRRELDKLQYEIAAAAGIPYKFNWIK